MHPTAERAVTMLTGKLAVVFSLALTLGLATYLSWNAWTLPPSDSALGGVEPFDHRWLAVAASLSACLWVVNIHNGFALRLWVSLLTATALGRALDLLLNGSSGLDRITETKAAMAWTLLWGGGIVAALLVNAYSLLWGAPPAPQRGEGLANGS